MNNKKRQDFERKNQVLHSKRAQIQLSFGMLFSIILIIVFIAFAVYGIGKFLDISNNAKMASAVNNFNNDVDDVWRTSASVQTQKSYVVPSKIVEVCFIQEVYGTFIEFNSKENTLEKSFDLGENEGKKIFIEAGNLCLKSINGRIAVTMKKDRGQDLVILME